MTNLQILELAAFTYFFMKFFKGFFFPSQELKENFAEKAKTPGFSSGMIITAIFILFLLGIWARRIITFF